MTPTMETRMQAAALADRLVFGSDTTFDPQDAAALLGLMPGVNRWASLLPEIRFRATVPRLGASGVAAGVGSVRTEGERMTLDLDSHGRRCLRAGQWRIYRVDHLRPGRAWISLEQVMSGQEHEEHKAALIRYRRGEPWRMDLYMPRRLRLPFLSLTVSLPVPWKTRARST